MPRLREPSPEDALARCPRCKGSCVVYDINAEEEIECPVCGGTGRVTQIEHRRYLGDVPLPPASP